MLSKIVGFTQQRLARSPLAVKAAMKLRNQCHAVIGSHVNGLFESDEYLIARVAPSMNSFIDIGANVGDWTGCFLKHSPTSTGLLLEPSRSAQAVLAKRYCDDPRVKILPIAAADRAGTATFYEEPEAGKTATLVGPTHLSNGSHAVQTSTVDAIMNERGLNRVDYIKIDTEGYDLHVLRGMTTTLGERRADFIQFEYSQRWAEVGATLGEAIHRLENAGYKVMLMGAGRLNEFDYTHYGEFCSFSNFVAISHNYRNLNLTRDPTT